MSASDSVLLREAEILRRHFTVIKKVGAISLVILVCILPSLILIGRSQAKRTQPLDYEVKQDVDDRLSCAYVKQFNLSKDLWLTVCNANHTIVLDIRRSKNDTMTEKGIRIDIQQWLTIKQLSRIIDIAINEARTYWKVIKRMNKEKRSLFLRKNYSDSGI